MDPSEHEPRPVIRDDQHFVCPACHRTAFTGVLGPGSVLDVKCRRSDCIHSKHGHYFRIIVPGHARVEECLTTN
jgi:hypothetical protein